MLQCKSACTLDLPTATHLQTLICTSVCHSMFLIPSLPPPPSLHIPFSTPFPQTPRPATNKNMRNFSFPSSSLLDRSFYTIQLPCLLLLPVEGKYDKCPETPEKLPLGGGRGTLQLLLPGAGLYGNISGEILWYFSCADQGLSSSLSIWNAFEFEGFPQFDLLHSSWQPKIYKSSAFRTFSIRLILTKLKLIKFHIAHKRWEFN